MAYWGQAPRAVGVELLMPWAPRAAMPVALGAAPKVAAEAVVWDWYAPALLALEPPASSCGLPWPTSRDNLKMTAQHAGVRHA